MGASGAVPATASNATRALSLLWLVIAPHSLGAAVLLLGGRRTDRWGHLLATGLALAAFVVGLICFFALHGRSADTREINQQLFSWIPVPGIGPAGTTTAGFQVDAGL